MPALGHPFIELPTTESTNIYAMEQARTKQASPGTVFFAHEQTHGKGQHGKRWLSDAGQNIAMSALVRPTSSDPAQGFPLSMAIALGCYDFYKNLAGDETAIKWPNDIYWRDRKAGGILIENIVRGEKWELAIVGIGININQVAFDPMLSNPVSLKQVTGLNYVPADLARNLCTYLNRRLEMLVHGHFNALWSDYQSALFGKGKSFRFKWNELEFDAIVEGVHNNGEIELRSGEKRMQFPHGSLEWISLKASD